MSFTYAIYVNVGKEIEVLEKIKTKIQLFGNPGIIEITALETFVQFIDKKIRKKSIKAIHEGYIYVTVEKTENGLLEMDRSCYHFLRYIPYVKKILNCFIPQEIWDNIKATIDTEPEVGILDSAKTFTLVKKAKEILAVLKAKKDENSRKFIKMLAKIYKTEKRKAHGKEKFYMIPLSLINIVSGPEDWPHKSPPDGLEQTFAQTLLQKLDNLFDKIVAQYGK
jgi:transcription antitermination factor NusG